MAETQANDRRSTLSGGLTPVRSRFDALEVGPELDRLPPPFFPSGARRSRAVVAPRPARGQAQEEEIAAIPDDAFISPDEPILRKPRVKEEPDGDEEEVVVSWIGDEAYFRGGTGSSPGAGAAPASRTSLDADTARKIAERLEALAESLRVMGGAALEIPPAGESFDVALRAFLAGYLAARGSGSAG